MARGRDGELENGEIANRQSCSQLFMCKYNTQINCSDEELL